MSTYITLSHLQVQNANGVSGMTYGFPAITHFMGYIHALSRKIEKSHQITLEGCAVICHQHQIHAYQPKGFGEYVFSQTRNPLTRTGKVAPIMEEGKMHLTVSLVTKCDGFIKGGEEGAAELLEVIKKLCLTQKLAGGGINSVKSVYLDTSNSDEQARSMNWRLYRRLLPGFVLVDRSSYLRKHHLLCKEKEPDTSILESWLDFVSLRFSAEALPDKNEAVTDKTKAKWTRVPKPEPGYLVPIMTGYKAISDIFTAGEQPNTRDANTPFCFVEAAYGLGEWMSPHRLDTIDDAFWFYQKQEGWYLCANDAIEGAENDSDDDNFDFL